MDEKIEAGQTQPLKRTHTLPIHVNTAAAEIEITPSIKKTYGGLRSVRKSGINNAIPFPCSLDERLHCPPFFGLAINRHFTKIPFRGDRAWGFWCNRLISSIIR
jgi:hypothetical protein